MSTTITYLVVGLTKNVKEGGLLLILGRRQHISYGYASNTRSLSVLVVMTLIQLLSLSQSFSSYKVGEPYNSKSIYG